MARNTNLDFLSKNLLSNIQSDAKILTLYALLLNRKMETELWRRKKKWLYVFVRQRGNRVG